MMQARKTLPPHYRERRMLDLSQNKLAALGLNVAGIGGFVLFGWLALLLLRTVRTDAGVIAWEAGARLQGLGPVVAVVIVIAIQIVMVILHEAIHGAFFWFFTRERPTFGLELPFATYAAAPDWYLPRNQHLVVGLAPFALISLSGLALSPVAPAAAVPALLLIATTNAAGCIGDFVMVIWLLTYPRDTFVQDTGAAITIYHPTPDP
jgi:hypothetical protein